MEYWSRALADVIDKIKGEEAEYPYHKTKKKPKEYEESVADDNGLYISPESLANVIKRLTDKDKEREPQSLDVRATEPEGGLKPSGLGFDYNPEAGRPNDADMSQQLRAEFEQLHGKIDSREKQNMFYQWVKEKTGNQLAE